MTLSNSDLKLVLTMKSSIKFPSIKGAIIVLLAYALIKSYLQNYFNFNNGMSGRIIVLVYGVVFDILFIKFLITAKGIEKLFKNNFITPLEIFSSLLFIYALQNLMPVISENIENLLSVSNDYISVWDFFFLTIPGVTFVVIIAPIVEEIIFRRVLLDSFLLRHRATTAIVISAIIFGTYHFVLIQGIIAGIIGLYIGIIYYYKKSLLLSIIIHSFNNFIAILHGRVFMEYGHQENVQNYIENMPKVGVILLILAILLHLYIGAKTVSFRVGYERAFLFLEKGVYGFATVALVVLLFGNFNKLKDDPEMVSRYEPNEFLDEEVLKEVDSIEETKESSKDKKEIESFLQNLSTTSNLLNSTISSRNSQFQNALKTIDEEYIQSLQLDIMIIKGEQKKISELFEPEGFKAYKEVILNKCTVIAKIQENSMNLLLSKSQSKKEDYEKNINKLINEYNILNELEQLKFMEALDENNIGYNLDDQGEIKIIW